MLAKYAVVKKSLKDKILSGEYVAAQPIPPERELGEIFGVSRITVRRAISELANEGLIYTEQGKGTFVADREKGLDLLSLTSCTEDLMAMGYQIRRKVLECEVIEADESLRAALHMEKSDVLRLTRIFFADEKSVNFTSTNIPLERFPGLHEFDFSVRSLYDIMKTEYGVQITRGSRHIEAKLPTPVIAKEMDMDPNIPILLFHCVTYGEKDGEEFPVESYASWYRSDLFSFYIDQVRAKE